MKPVKKLLNFYIYISLKTNSELKIEMKVPFSVYKCHVQPFTIAFVV